MIPAAVQTFAAMAPSFARAEEQTSPEMTAENPKFNAWSENNNTETDPARDGDTPIRWRVNVGQGDKGVEQKRADKKMSTAILKELKEQDAASARRLVSRYSVVEELNTDSNKDGQGDSGIWRDSLDGNKPADQEDDDSSSSDSDVGDEASHFPILDPSQDAKMSVNEISVYAHFIKIGDIDTKNQRFSAFVELIARWVPEKNKLFNDFFKMCMEHPYVDADDGRNGIRKIIPKVLINNLESSSLEKTTFSMRPTGATDYTCVSYVEMHKMVRGVFYERLELQSFPFDVQDICLRISLDHSSQSHFRLFVPEMDSPAGLLGDSTTFQDDQEWVLRRLVAAGENNSDADPPRKRRCASNTQSDASGGEGGGGGNNSGNPETSDGQQILIIRTNVQRKFNYFIYNCFLVMVFFSIMSYGNFANKPENVQFRLGGALTLVLTAVTYKLMLSNSLPTISYLTLIDIYVLFQIFMMTLLAVTFAVLHWVWRWYADDIDLEEQFQHCEKRFQFVTPETKCELTALANLLDVICVSVHGTIQILFNITFTTYVYKKVKRESDHFVEQESEYRKFLDSNPEMTHMWKRMSYSKRGARNAIKPIGLQLDDSTQSNLKVKNSIEKGKMTSTGESPSAMKTAQMIV
ncbi:uncharacterized protein LOC142344885 isoform X4 [Convolutriloba macropyga]|uniref:uncharacterized protein LOC142344885 isoform X4 n=1 Tax=Convolutriloba macropyga TaxID=536237 RepID=UPI003F521E17